MTGLKRSECLRVRAASQPITSCSDPRLRLTVGNVIETHEHAGFQRAVKRISVVKTGQIPVKTSDTNLTEAIRLAEQARTNRLQVIEGALTVENQLNAVILHYFFGSSHERRAVFESLILNSDSCSFAAKRKLITHIINEQKLLEGRDKSDFDKLMKDVMSVNAFAHGKFVSDENRVWLSFFAVKPQEQELTDQYLTEIETLLRVAFDRTFELVQKIGASKSAENTTETI